MGAVSHALLNDVVRFANHVPIPTVVMKLGWKPPSLNCMMRHVLPTAVSPMVRIFRSMADCSEPPSFIWFMPVYASRGPASNYGGGRSESTRSTGHSSFFPSSQFFKFVLYRIFKILIKI